jgi:hypothetical protein
MPEDTPSRHLLMLFTNKTTYVCKVKQICAVVTLVMF